MNIIFVFAIAIFWIQVRRGALMFIFPQLLLTCLMVYASSAQAIMVKFGIKGGPIEPPALEPIPSPQPYRVPAPVWEERSNDTPDPNAQW